MRFSRRSTALGATVAAIGLLPVAIAITADATTTELLSRGRPAVASAVLSAAFSPDKAVDDSGRTRWAAAGPGTQWLRLDLGGVELIDRVRIVWAAAYPATYRVQVSTDGASWDDLHSTRTGNGGTDDLTRLAGVGRYVRVLATQPGAGTGYSLWELQIYGTRRPTAPPADAASGPSGTGPSGTGPSGIGPTGTGPTGTGPSGAAATDPTGAAGLADPTRKDLAMQVVASAEHSSLRWKDRYGAIEDLGDGLGYTGGIIGFRSGTSDMLAVVAEYVRRKPDNVLREYLTALREVNGSDSHQGLGEGFTEAWRAAAEDPEFQQVQRDERDRIYFDPAVEQAKADGLRALGQFIYYDAAVVHGANGMRNIRAAALRVTPSPAQGGDELTYLDAYLDARVARLRAESASADTSRVDTAQREFLRAANLDLDMPLTWRVGGAAYRVG
ncbi:MAG TPA: chitosanase [Actinoplanes sp.]|nr:chitosanase [Actinoplanes sp.]